jgi:lipopolysaccharide export system permease protein
MTCFLPIMLLYYPLLLGLQNLSKDGKVLPAALWLGNAGMAATAWVVLRWVLRH